MKELTMHNGDVQDAPKIRLRCTHCSPNRTRFVRDGENVVRCRECGKRHSVDSLTDVNTPLA